MQGVAPPWERGLKYSALRQRGQPDRVAPPWERGLKCVSKAHRLCITGRSPLGAWIEIVHSQRPMSRHRVAPPWERGLKFINGGTFKHKPRVAPAWERGLKSSSSSTKVDAIMSLPLGSVDRNKN